MAKYKIGNWVSLEGTADIIKMRVTSIIEETCTAEKQTFYVCRSFMKSHYSAKEEWLTVSNKDGFELRKYNEIELIPYSQSKKEKTNA